MKSNIVYFWSAVVALGGFLFGFDTSVISGAEKAIQEVWHLNSLTHGFTITSGLIGTILGAVFAGRPAQQYGRRKILFVTALLYFICAIGCAVTSDWAVFILARALGGVGVGASSVVGPMYIAEVAPAKIRGSLVGMFQLNVVFGIMFAYISNYFLMDFGDEPWRWMLGIQAIPSVLFFVLLLFVPESPRWLLMKGKDHEAVRIFKRIGGTSTDVLLEDVETEKSIGKQDGKASILDKVYRKPLVFSLTLAVFNQLTGINALLYFAPRIFEITNIGRESAFLQSISIGLTLFIFTLLGVFLIDRFGRRTLLLVGTVGMAVFLFISGWTLGLNVPGYWPMVSLMGFIVFFSFSQGAVIWVFISEIFPNNVRSIGQSLGSTTHWLMAALVSFLFPVVAEQVVDGIRFSFYFFGFMMLLHFVFVYRFLPETKGKSLEEIADQMTHR